MRMLILTAGVAALAIAAPAAAGPKGGGHGGAYAQAQHGGGGQKAHSGGGRQAQAQRGGGGQRRVMAQSHGGGQRRAMAQSHGGGRNAQRIEHRSGGQRRMMAQAHGGGRSAQRVEHRGGSQRFASFQSERGHGRAQHVERTSRTRHEVARVENRGRGRERFEVQNRGGREQRVAMENRAFRGRDQRLAIVDRAGNTVRLRGFDQNRDLIRVREVDRGVVRFRDVDPDAVFVRRLGYGLNGCPPGLANKGCLPPGQARKLVGMPIRAVAPLGFVEPLPSPFRSLYYDSPDYYYRYGGGYLYRVDRDRDLISAMIPLFGAAFVGRPLAPSYVNSYYTPPYYSAFYPNSPYDCYRNGYGYVYETDCVTGLVEDVIPTYDYGYGIGQIMPASYGYYNLPVPYRSYFADNDDYYYRYAPGAIYRVDRDTALVSAVVALLTGGLTVGQPLPLGYSTYNVPLAYRTAYYDTPNTWYRYNNGYIYSVNPGTRMVTGIVEYI